MKKLYTQLLGFAGLVTISVGVCNAQTGTLALKAPAGAITIDGVSKDWGDSLSYYNTDKKIHYAISNDKDNLYLVVKTRDPAQENNILAGGLTFSINTKGKKSRTFSTTFPKPSGNTMLAIAKPGESLGDKKLRANVTRFKKIGVDGFKDINDDELTGSNTYGIQIAINYDEDGGLVYEEAIPLALFHASADQAKGEWAFNIELNGFEGPGGNNNTSSGISSGIAAVPSGSRPSGGSGRGGRQSGADATASLASSATANRGSSTPTIDFWGKFTLAQ